MHDHRCRTISRGPTVAGLTVVAVVTALVSRPDCRADGPPAPYRFEVVEQGTGRPVPLVELRTTHHLRFVSDNAGMIAIDAPELMGRATWFDVIGHGYEVTADGLGSRGFRTVIEPGGRSRLAVKRTAIAERVGRLTGVGMLAESRKLGDTTYESVEQPGVTGCDTVQNAVHNGKLYWFWGDTTVPHYKLGLFQATAATTDIPTAAALETPLRLKFDYFCNDDGKPRNVAVMPGSGPTWLTGVVDLPDEAGVHRLVASYVKIKPPLEVYEWGRCVWNDEVERFDKLDVLWTKSDQSPKPPPMAEGHAFEWTDDKGKRWAMFGNPLPTLRCPATFEGWYDRAKWETLQPPTHLKSATDDKPVKMHGGSLAWNAYRKRFVTVFVEEFGKPSYLGELWYAEAESPTGPFGPAVKVMTHENYTFYNPRLHPEFVADEDSPALYFEGTYTATFAKYPDPTPRWDYNQVLYRLKLDDPRLKPAQR